MSDESVGLIPSMLNNCLFQLLQSDGLASREQIASLLRMLELFSTILRSHHHVKESAAGRNNPAKFLRLLLKDRYVECLVEFFGRVKIEDRAVRQVFTEHVDEFKHCLHSSASEHETSLYQRRLSLFTQICYKRINIDFNTISLQLVGSLGLPENLREILTQLDEADLLVFFSAFKLPIPA